MIGATAPPWLASAELPGVHPAEHVSLTAAPLSQGVWLREPCALRVLRWVGDDDDGARGGCGKLERVEPAQPEQDSHWKGVWSAPLVRVQFAPGEARAQTAGGYHCGARAGAPAADRGSDSRIPACVSGSGASKRSERR
jgi:hypothetical protein